MEKKIIADGTQERLCPKCDTAMTLHPGGVIESFGAGEYIQQDEPDVWQCKNCQLVTDEELDREESRLIDLILDEGERDGLESMADHPQYQKLIITQKRREEMRWAR